MKRMGKLKNILMNIVNGLVIVIIIIVCWLAIAWLYPDEWFADIPKFLLSLLGL